MSDLLRINVLGEDKLTALLKRIPKGSGKTALTEFMKYVVGNPSHGLKHYPPYQSPTYIRTYKLQGGWYAKPPTETQGYIGNPVPYSIYPQGQPPARQMIPIGWRGHMDVIASNQQGGIRMATLAVIRWIKSFLP